MQYPELVVIDTLPKYEERLYSIVTVADKHELNDKLAEGWKIKHMVPWGENVLVCIYKETN
jgi:hypothetical protein